MRITFLLPPVNLSGGLRVVDIHARGLRARGHEMVLVSPPPRRPTLRESFRSLRHGNGWPRPEKSVSPFGGSGLDHRVIDRWRPIVDADLPDADVVVATWWETAEWLDALGPAKGAKVYFVQGHEVYDYLPVARCRATYRMPLRKIVISRWLADVLAAEYGETAVDMVHNGFDPTRFHAPPRGRQPVPTVGFLYNRTPLKAVEVALRVLDSLRAGHPDLRILAFGAERPDGDPLFDGRIEFQHLPSPDRLRELYASCDAWLTTSRSEGFNLTAMEAMACGTPVVSTRTGWPVEAIEPGRNGMLADVDDEAALAAGLHWLLGLLDAEWRRVSEAALATVEGCTWERATARFEQVLLDAAKAEGRMQ